MFADAPLGTWAVTIPAALFTAIAIMEYLRPRHRGAMARNIRWRTHLGFFAANAITGQILAFLVIVPIAADWAQRSGFGLIHWFDLPPLAAWLIAFILLDFAVWLQHVLMHHVPLFWRAHSVHHSDGRLDLTTALRFHPLEIILSTLYKSAWVALLGVPILVALAFELWLNGNALFNHSNIRLPRWVDRPLRLLIVTPDMHLVHHSTQRREQNSNFGFALTIWDRLFGVYLASASQDGAKQAVGLAETQDGGPEKFLWSMGQPFRNVS